MIICVLIFPGCSRKNPGSTQPSEASAQQIEQICDNLQQILDIDDASAEEITVTQVQSYDDETVVRYTQTYRGVEIYGSSIVATSADEGFFGGTYYDLSEAFGEDFEAQAAAVSQYPSWMTDSDAVTFLRDTYRPVIYIADDNQAHLAVCFYVQVTGGDTGCLLEFVVSHDGSRVFLVSAVNQAFGFTDAQVDTGFGTMTITRDGDTYYAYNRENNVYVTKAIFNDDNDDRKADAKPYMELKDGDNYHTPNFRPDLIYSSKSDNWSQGERDTAINLLKTFCDINQWYGTRYGYWSLDGKGGVNILGVMEEQDGSPAINYNATLIWAQPNAVTYPEIMAHEFFHAIFARTLGLNVRNQAQNQTAALNEGIADTFGALYLLTTLDPGSGHDAFGILELENCWILAKGLDGDDKNIPAMNYTMDDYRMDRYSDHEEYDTGNPFSSDMWRYNFDVVMDYIEADGSIRLENCSTAEAHHNSYIISNTMYRIWREVLDRDAEALSRILYRSLRYLPSNADFNDFRSAFLRAAKQLYGQTVADAAGVQFDKAGIKEGVAGVVIKILESRQKVEYLLEYCTSDYAAIFRDFEYSSYTNPDINGDGGNVWNCTCMLGQGAAIVFTFASDYEDPNATPFCATIDDLLYWSGSSAGLKLCEGLKLGMTYAEASDALDLSELTWAPEQTWTEPVYICYGGAFGCALELYFVGADEDSAVLVSVNATPIG